MHAWAPVLPDLPPKLIIEQGRHCFSLRLAQIIAHGRYSSALCPAACLGRMFNNSIIVVLNYSQPDYSQVLCLPYGHGTSMVCLVGGDYLVPSNSPEQWVKFPQAVCVHFCAFFFFYWTTGIPTPTPGTLENSGVNRWW